MNTASISCFDGEVMTKVCYIYVFMLSRQIFSSWFDRIKVIEGVLNSCVVSLPLCKFMSVTHIAAQ